MKETESPPQPWGERDRDPLSEKEGDHPIFLIVPWHEEDRDPRAFPGVMGTETILSTAQALR